MGLSRPEDRGLALGAWGAAQALAAGLAIAVSGIVHDLGSSLAEQGSLGETLATPVTGYSIVYAIEILLLFTTLVAIGPLVRFTPIAERGKEPSRLELIPPPGLNSGVMR
jgi:BCD family chlorophyll transporter-like MFS transporter